MKAYLLEAEHPTVPGNIVRLFKSSARADVEAATLLTSIVEDLKDLELDEKPPEGPINFDNWREQLQGWYAATASNTPEWYITVTELTLE